MLPQATACALVTIATASIAAPAASQAVTETARLTGPDIVAGDIFAFWLTTNGTTVAVGAPFKHVPTDDEGAVYLFERSGSAWPFKQKIFPAVRQTDMNFGLELDMDGPWLAVGAFGTRSVYLFENVGGTWVERDKLTSPAAGVGGDDAFSAGIRVIGERLFIGAPLAKVGTGFGVVYVFERRAGAWVNTGKLEPAQPTFTNFQAAGAIDVRGDRVVVGGQSSQPAGLVGAGAAYVFERGPSGWTNTALLLPDAPEPNGRFGWSVALRGESILVSADRADGYAGDNTGALYEFNLVGGKWTQTSKFTPTGLTGNPYFGEWLSTQGDCVVAGAYQDAYRGGASGSAHLLQRDAAGWSVKQKFAGGVVDAGDLFGWQLKAANGVLAVAAPFDGRGGLQAGAAYIFDISCPSACAADCRGDGKLDVLDFVCFQNAFALADLAKADVGGSSACAPDGALSIADFTCFQNMFAAGCP